MPLELRRQAAAAIIGVSGDQSDDERSLAAVCTCARMNQSGVHCLRDERQKRAEKASGKSERLAKLRLFVL